MVPQQLNFQESLHVCKKLSGKVISYSERDEFDDLVYYLSLTNNMRASACTEDKESSSLLQVWAGGTDAEVEGIWRKHDHNTSIKVNTIDCKQNILRSFTTQHLPWGENRPYNDGELYNCLVIRTLMKDIGNPHYQVENINVVDDGQFIVALRMQTYVDENIGRWKANLI